MMPLFLSNHEFFPQLPITPIITLTHLDQAAVAGEVSGEPSTDSHIITQSIVGSHTTATVLYISIKQKESAHGQRIKVEAS